MNWEFMGNTFVKALSGIPTTMFITVATLVLSTPFAFLVAIARNKKVPVLQKILAVYVSFIRGTPIVVQIYLIYNTLPSALNVWTKRWEMDVNIFDIDPVVYALVIFVLNITATMSEVIRSALSTVDKGQMEAALSMGLSELQGYTRIVLPQALVSAVPNLCTLIVSLIKMTSLAFIMTIQDITAIAKIEAGAGLNYFEAYLSIFALYLIICITIERVFKVIEKRLKRYKTAVA